MKDYKMINEAITVAEELLIQEKQSYEKCVCNSEWEIKYEICNYIYNILQDTKFPNFSIRIENYNPLIESYYISFSSGDYGCDGIHFKYQLFIKDNKNNKVSRIFFHEEDYYESTNQPIQEDTLLILIKSWKELKSKLPIEIDKTYQQRINQIKQEANEIKRKQEILESFKL